VIDLLIVLLVPALKAVDGKSRNPLHWLAALIAWPIDVFIAHTTWRGIAGPPQKGEWTISDTLERLCLDYQDPNRMFFVALAKYINRVSPTKNHIKAVL
jgi:hypothetical protein